MTHCNVKVQELLASGVQWMLMFVAASHNSDLLFTANHKWPIINGSPFVPPSWQVPGTYTSSGFVCVTTIQGCGNLQLVLDMETIMP